MNKLSATTSVFVNYAIPDVISRVAQAGYTGIDIWGGRPHVYRQDYSGKDLKALRTSLNDSGLVVSSFMPAFFRYPHSLSNPNAVVRNDSIDYMRVCADNAASLGAELLLVVPGRSVHGQRQEDAFRLLLDSIYQVCDYCEDYDFKIGIEPANQAVTDLVVSHEDAKKIIDQINCPSLGVVMDTGHMHLNQEDLAVATHLLGSHLLQFHINDNDGVQQQNSIPGEGTYDFSGFFKHIEKLEFDGFLSVELGWHYTLGPEKAIQTAFHQIRKLLHN